MAEGLPETRFTRITATYLDELHDEQPELPPKPTKAEKRAARKEAKRLEKIEEQKLIMRHELKTELELGKRMEQMGLEEWKAMAEDIKIAELRDELVMWGERATEIMEHKNDLIQILIEDLHQTEDQHSHSFSKTAEMIDHITNCYSVMLESSKQMYDQQTEEMLKEYYEEVKFKAEETEAMHKNTENIIHATNIVTRDQLKSDYEIFQEQRDDIINKNIEARFQIRDQVVSKMADMQRHLSEFVESLQNTKLDATKNERMRALTDRQQAFVEETRKLDVEEMKCIEEQSEVERETLRIETEDNATINDLKMELEYFEKLRKKIEEGMHVDRVTTHEKLRTLSTESYELIKKFEKIVKSGELLLALSITCRKMQTESEKIILGGEIVDPVNVGDVNENFTIEALELKKHLDITEADIVELNKSMRNFWRKQSMAQIQNMLLLEEKRKLTEENQRYLDFIKSMSKASKLEELHSALTVNACIQPTPFLFDTRCVDFKLRTKKESITAGRDGRRNAVKAIKTIVDGNTTSGRSKLKLYRSIKSSKDTSEDDKKNRF